MCTSAMLWFRILRYSITSLMYMTFIYTNQNVDACEVGFYNKLCLKAESIVRQVVTNKLSHNKGMGAALLRLHFHDCFVEGCDGSVLLDSTPGKPAEKDAAPNLSLRGFDIIDLVKSKIEERCPNTVSCADILAFAARDSVHLLGGPFWQVPAGRRDGLISNAAHAVANLPAPFFNLKQLTRSFGLKGLTQDEMITLSGAHTIGIAHCSSFKYRIYNFSTSNSIDPSLNEQFVEILKSTCPFIGPSNPTLSLDTITPDKFDNAYYANVQLGQGLLQSDAALFLDPKISKTVRANVMSQTTWFNKFKEAMFKMSLIEVKTDSTGEIRRNCHFPNKK